MGRMLTLAALVPFVALALVADAQWLDRPTPNMPRMPDGKPNLTAPAPRGADGHPDFSGLWTGRPVVLGVPDSALTASSKALLREREGNYLRDRPYFQCQPTGPETIAGSRRIVQTPTLIAIVHETLTSRLIFVDGRKLEADPERVWMGYSVGRWDGDTLIVDSFGFNDRTWLDARGLPHTEALRMTERYQRRSVGQLQVELTATDPGAFTGSYTVTYNLQLQPDTEMVEAVCEDRTHWIGHLSEVESTAVTVTPSTLAKYVGVYGGLWGTAQRTVRVQLEDGTLYASGLVGDRIRLIPQSASSFAGSDGLSFDFDPDGDPAAYMVERHVSGDWRYKRKPQN